MVFAIHSHASTVGVHVFPILTPPTSFIRSLLTTNLGKTQNPCPLLRLLQRRLALREGLTRPVSQSEWVVAGIRSRVFDSQPWTLPSGPSFQNAWGFNILWLGETDLRQIKENSDAKCFVKSLSSLLFLNHSQTVTVTLCCICYNVISYSK